MRHITSQKLFDCLFVHVTLLTQITAKQRLVMLHAQTLMNCDHKPKTRSAERHSPWALCYLMVSL